MSSSSSSFLGLPREIRDQIYIYVLRSPTQTVNLSWHDADEDEYEWILPKTKLKIVPFDPEGYIALPDQAMRLSFLRTCKMIHAECRDIIWRLNSLFLKRPTELTPLVRWENLKNQFGQHLQHVEMEYTMFFPVGMIDPVQKALVPIVLWSRTGNLKKVTLTFGLTFRGGRTDRGFFHDLTRQREVRKAFYSLNMRHFRDSVDVLQDFGGGEQGLAPHIEKKLVLSTTLAIKKQMEKDEWMKTWVEFNSSGFAKQVNEAFGGELWVDRILCYRDGVHIKTGFEAVKDGGMSPY